jgi:hypothetical protein
MIAMKEVDGPGLAGELADLMLSGPEHLKEGKCYAVLHFLDKDLRFPEVGFWVYVGKDLEGRGENRWYFQDTKSYFKYGSAAASAGRRRRTIFVADQNELTHMFDLVGVGQALIRLGSA